MSPLFTPIFPPPMLSGRCRARTRRAGEPGCIADRRAGEKIISKIAVLLLAAIAVMMVRKGIEAFIAAGVGG